MRVQAPITIIAVCLAFTVGCRQDPVAASRASAKRAEKYVAQKRTADAIVEYRKAVAAYPKNAQARQALAKLYLDVNDVQNAYGEFIRAADLLPQDVDAQMDAGKILLAAGRFDDAMARADKALKVQPRSTNAQILKANALAGLKDLDAAVAEIESAIQADPSAGIAYSSLGALQFAKGDTGAAAAAFKRAVAADPKSVAAQLALANYYWAINQRTDAEAALKAAIDVEPKNVLANRALAIFYIGAGRKDEAEGPLKVFAEVASQPAGSLTLADYYIAMQRYANAKVVLDRLAADPQGFEPATIRLAALGLAAGNRDEAYRLIESVLKKNPKQLDALMGKARLQFSDGKLDEANVTAQAAIAVNRASPLAQYLLGMVQTALDRKDEGSNAFREALRLNPNFAPAQVELARAALAVGKYDEAIQFAESAIAIVPGYSDAYLLQARAELAKNNAAGAERPLKILESVLASNPVVRTELGRLYALKGNRPAARKAFEQALKDDPRRVDALSGLVQLDFEDRNPAAARSRVEAAESASPKDERVKLVAGNTYNALGDLASAERALKQAMELGPNNLQVYEALARVYARQGRLAEATAEFDALAEREPKVTMPVTLAGVLLLLQNRSDEAAARFEKALAIDAQAPVAANNLAWLYAERNEKLDVALQLAQTAKSRLPNNDAVDDTLGWVYYKKGLSTLAVAAFQRSVQLQPDNPSYLGHLGLAYAQNGDKDKARQSLQRALRLKEDFDGAAEARRVLKSLEG